MKSYVKKSFDSLLNNFAVRVLLGIVLMFISSQVCIPIEPVPITLQSAGVLIISLTYLRAEAMTALSAYLLLGAVGIPVFSDLSGGINILFGKTGGYLLGMLFCAYLITTGRQKYRERSYKHLFGYSLMGSASIFMLGVPWLGYYIGFEKAIQFGLLPFIIPGFVKVLFTIATIRLFKQKLCTAQD